MPDANEIFHAIYLVGWGFMGLWGFITVVKNIKSTNDEEVKKRKRWDDAAKIVEEGHEKWDAALADMETGRQRMMMRYDDRLDDQDAKLDGQDAKIQDILAICVELLRSNDAILDALISAGIGNGEIKNMRDGLSDFITGQIRKG